MSPRRKMQISRPTDEVLLGEVARVLGIARSTAWTRALRGEIPAEWRGGRYVVKRRTLARLAAAASSAGTDDLSQSA